MKDAYCIGFYSSEFGKPLCCTGTWATEFGLVTALKLHKIEFWSYVIKVIKIMP